MDLMQVHVSDGGQPSFVSYNAKLYDQPFPPMKQMKPQPQGIHTADRIWKALWAAYLRLQTLLQFVLDNM